MIAPSVYVALIAAMVTPALLILASASLVASALVRMARVVDRTRVLSAIVHEGTWERSGITPDHLRTWLERHAKRARYAERSIALLYAAVVVFIATCLAIALGRATDQLPSWSPVFLAIAGSILFLGGGVYMVIESSLSGKQISEEIRYALAGLEGKKS